MTLGVQSGSIPGVQGVGRIQKRSVISCAVASVFITGAALAALSTGSAHAQQGQLLYVPNGVGDSLSVFSTNSNGSLTAVTTLTAFGNSPEQAVVRGDQAFAYVTLNLDNQVKVIDTKTNTVVQTVSALTGPRGIAVSPDGTRVAVANNTGGTNTVAVFTANPING